MQCTPGKQGGSKDQSDYISKSLSVALAKAYAVVNINNVSKLQPRNPRAKPKADERARNTPGGLAH